MECEFGSIDTADVRNREGKKPFRVNSWVSLTMRCDMTNKLAASGDLYGQLLNAHGSSMLINQNDHQTEKQIVGTMATA